MRLLIPALPRALNIKWVPQDPADASPPWEFGVSIVQDFGSRTTGWFAVISLGVRDLNVWLEKSPTPPPRSK